MLLNFQYERGQARGRKRVHFVLLTMFALVAALGANALWMPSVEARGHCEWLGGEGSWFDASKWLDLGDCPDVPGPNDEAWIAIRDSRVVIDGDPAFSGGLTLRRGRVDIVNGGTLTSRSSYHAIGAISDAATMRIAGAGSAWYVENGNVRVGRSADGTLIVADEGVLRINGNNRLVLGEHGAPGTTQGRGTLVIGGEAGEAALAPGFVYADEIHMGWGDGGDGTEASGLIVFNHTDTNYTFAPNVHGVGGILQQNGTTVLTGANSYKGTTVVEGGVLQVAGDDNLGDADGGLTFAGGALRVTGDGSGSDYVLMQRAVNLTATGTVDVGRGDGSGDVVLEWAGLVSGTGALVKTGTGELVLSRAANDYAGGTIIKQGVLTMTADGALGFGDVWVDGVGGRLNVRGVSVGARTVHVAADGQLTFEGGADGAETTVVAAADAVVDITAATGGVAIGSLSGDGRVLIGDGQLTLGGLGLDDVFTGVIDDGDLGGQLVKVGGGILTLTGDHTYSGATTVAAGTLHVDGSLASSAVSVRHGATLRGTGTVGTTIVAAGGTLAAGGAVASGGASPSGTLTVDGDLTFEEGSRLTVEVDPEGEEADLIRVRGEATLAGGSVLHVGADGKYRPTQTYRLLHAEGGLTGRFDDVTSNFAFLTPGLVYDDDGRTILLQLTRNDWRFEQLGTTPNRRATARGADSLPANHAVYDAVAGLPDDQQVIDEAFDLLSGEIHASLGGSVAGGIGLFHELLLDRASERGVSDSPWLAVAAAGTNDDGIFDWAETSVQHGMRRGDGNANDVIQETTRFVIGADKRLDRGGTVGLAVGYAGGALSVEELRSRGRDTAGYIGLYGSASNDRWDISGGLAFTVHRASTERQAVLGNVNHVLQSNYGGRALSLFGRIDRTLDARWALTPFAQVEHTAAGTDAFTETGGPAALASAGQAASWTAGSVGVRMGSRFTMGKARAAWDGEIAWVSVFGAEAATSRHAFVGGDTFTVQGASGQQSGARVRIGLAVEVARDLSLGLHYNGRISGIGGEHGAATSLRVRF